VKPDCFGWKAAIFRDKSGCANGKAQTGKRNFFGWKKTKVKGKTPLDSLSEMVVCHVVSCRGSLLWFKRDSPFTD
jgi:hypothetical protein